jgi:hypothetical protein
MGATSMNFVFRRERMLPPRSFSADQIPIDDNPFDKIVPPADVLYVGWTEPREWFNVTPDVPQAGTYAADFLYTSNRGGTISVDVDGKGATGNLCRSPQRMTRQIRWPAFNGNI